MTILTKDLEVVPGHRMVAGGCFSEEDGLNTGKKTKMHGIFSFNTYLKVFLKILKLFYKPTTTIR